jgi:hypothetical protein
MGRLAGFSADEVIRKLRQAGFVFDRQSKGSHEIWWNPKTHARSLGGLMERMKEAIQLCLEVEGGMASKPLQLVCVQKVAL